MNRKKFETLLASLGSVVLAGATALTMSYAIKALPKSMVVRVGAFLCAPTAALAAEKIIYEDTQMPAVEAAQTYDENDLSSGFWTQAPKPEEIVQPPQSAPPQAEMPQGSVPIEIANYKNGTGERYIPCNGSTIRNSTKLPAAEIAAEVGAPLGFNIEKNSAEPQILIMHTHATETYQLTGELWANPEFTARTTDYELNMAAIGEEMKKEFEAAGINTIHDVTLHDYPSYTGSYERSNKTVRKYLEQYPSIKIVLDVHRDAIQRDDGTRVKPLTEINKEQTAQVMIICGADKNGNLPNFKQNLRFAAAWQAKMEELYPTLARPVLFDYRYYNQDLTTGSLLLEVGGHANTIDEAKRAGAFAAKAICNLF